MIEKIKIYWSKYKRLNVRERSLTIIAIVSIFLLLTDLSFSDSEELKSLNISVAKKKNELDNLIKKRQLIVPVVKAKDSGREIIFKNNLSDPKKQKKVCDDSFASNLLELISTEQRMKLKKSEVNLIGQPSNLYPGFFVHSVMFGGNAQWDNFQTFVEKQFNDAPCVTFVKIDIKASENDGLSYSIFLNVLSDQREWFESLAEAK